MKTGNWAPDDAMEKLIWGPFNDDDEIGAPWWPDGEIGGP